jgi:hypothetical protein
MDVILFTDDVDAQECDVLVTGLFQDERPLQGSAGWIDWRLNGKLSRFLKEERLTGSWKETTLIPSEGRVTPRMILLLGLGSLRDYSYLRLRELAPYMIETLRNIRASRVSLSFPHGENTNVDCGKLTEVLIEGIVDHLDKNPEAPDDEWNRKLSLFFPVDARRFPEILLGVQTAKSILEERHKIRIFIPTKEPR